MHSSYDFDATSVPTHETGHNFGTWDLYNNSDGSYDPNLNFPNNWDIMDQDGPRSHTCVWHKELIEQWFTAKGANIDTFPTPPNLGDIQTRHYVVTPLEYSPVTYDANLTGVPAGRTVVKVIRLPLGRGQAANDHFLMVENRQAGH